VFLFLGVPLFTFECTSQNQNLYWRGVQRKNIANNIEKFSLMKLSVWNFYNLLNWIKFFYFQLPYYQLSNLVAVLLIVTNITITMLFPEPSSRLLKTTQSSEYDRRNRVIQKLALTSPLVATRTTELRLLNRTYNKGLTLSVVTRFHHVYKTGMYGYFYT